MATFTRIHLICEGETEEMFVKNILSEEFTQKNIELRPSIIGKPGHKGGYVTFERLKGDICPRLLEDKNSYCTTFFDFYGLPTDFPGKAEAEKQTDIEQKAAVLVGALTEQFRKALGNEPVTRLIPYVQMYEFEGLLFSDPEKFAQGIYRVDLKEKLKDIRMTFSSPEAINNSWDTAPSKCIVKLYPGYQKPLHGSLAATQIGLRVIRQECKLFNKWLTHLETLRPKITEGNTQ